MYVCMCTHAHTHSLPSPTLTHTPHKYIQSANKLQMVRMLESSVLAWNKQIRATLSEDPESLDATKGGDRWPSSELDFWSEHSKELHSMSTQVSLSTCMRASTRTTKSHERIAIAAYVLKRYLCLF